MKLGKFESLLTIKKNYLEYEKLFTNIAPYFNTKDRNDSTDIGYLAMFIDEISRALNMKFNIDQSVDEFVCDYIIQSIKKSV
ncbi:hypothetical protein ACT7DN_32060 [Bacillus paranthracis]